jgi:CDP-glucose 4,6-dehydratase
MESVVMKRKFWVGKRVLVTGHTGFKGGWLSLWLNDLGANVIGFSLAPIEENVFYSKVFSTGFVGPEVLGDITDYQKVSDCINSFNPEVIFHLAAQPLVRHSYKDPMTTFATNTMGVVNLLESVRRSPSIIAPVIVNITTDKVYKNNEWHWPYREPEPLGGNDPYSASKACSEIITNSYVKSYFNDSVIRVATARAGNVIGGGDMSVDRLIPDYFRALSNNQEIRIRNPLATRPWQHVTEPLAGYLKLAELLYSEDGGSYVGAWNFGPNGEPVSVEEVLNKLSEISAGKKFSLDSNSNPHEAQSLMLDSSKARNLLGWRPKLGLNQALSMTFDWFQESIRTANMSEFTIRQISEYKSIEPV